MKIQISFVYKKIRSENTDQFCALEKKIRFVFNENTYKFCALKKIRSVFNENIYQFCALGKNQIYI